jgi:hypothetical protein
MFHPLDLLWLAIPAYLIMQVVALLRTSGGFRLAAALPLVVMLPVFAITIIDAARESNMWPVLMLLASPVALLYVAVVALLA